MNREGNKQVVMAEKYTFRQDMAERIRTCLLSYEPTAALLSGAEVDTYRPLLWQFVKQVEQGVLDQTKLRCSKYGILALVEREDFQTMYQFSAYSLLANLDCNSLVSRALPGGQIYLPKCCYFYLLLRNQLAGPAADLLCRAVVNPSLLAGAPPEYLNPYADADIRSQYLQRGKISDEDEYSSLYLCEKCGKRKTKMRKLQLRRADEAQSLRITCGQCGHTWNL